jgi:hypothetical protein
MFRVFNVKNGEKKIVRANNVEELILNGCQKLVLLQANVTLKSDEGIIIDDEDAFVYAEKRDIEICFYEKEK